MNDSLNADTLVQALRCSSSKRNGGSITYINGQSDEHSITYRALLDRASGVLYYLQREGLQPDTELIIFLDNNAQFVDVFWACMLGRIVAVPLAVGPGDVHYQKLFNVFRKLYKPFLYISSQNLQRLEKFAHTHGLDDDFVRMRKSTVLADACADPDQPGETADVRSGDSRVYPVFLRFDRRAKGCWVDAP